MPGMLTSLTMKSGWLLPRGLEAGQAVGGEHDLEALELQEGLHDRRDGRAVVDHEHSPARRVGGRLAHRAGDHRCGCHRCGGHRRTRRSRDRRGPVSLGFSHVRSVGRHDAEQFVKRRETPCRLLHAVLEQRSHAGVPRGLSNRLFGASSPSSTSSRISSLTSSSS